MTKDDKRLSFVSKSVVDGKGRNLPHQGGRRCSFITSTAEPYDPSKHVEEKLVADSEVMPDNVKLILERAKKAQEEFNEFPQEKVDKIFDYIANDANKHRVPLAKLAASETGMGQFEDKVIKNGIACELIHDRYKDAKTCDLIETDPIHGKHTYAFPAGPVAAITPVTNPTSTAISKALMMAKTRNAGVVLPHTKAIKCTSEAVRICREAGEKAGAPKWWLQSIENNTRAIATQVMHSPEISLILSTGGPGIVKASYSSGKPAIGVGGGNAPVLVDELADLKQACGSIILGKTFDWGVICAAEQSVVVVDEVYDELKEMFIARGTFFLEGDDREKLAAFIEKDGRINPDIVGQSAVEIAKRAGITTELPKGTVVLATEELVVGHENPLSKEKLSPVLSMFRARDFEHGLELSEALARNGGVGHTAGIYTGQENELSDRVRAYTKRVPVGRIIVNSPTSLTAIGTAFNFSVDPTFTLGVGTHAGSSLSSNATPFHLINTTTVAERQKHIEWFNLPKRIYFNRGCLEEALTHCARPDEYGNRPNRAMIITGIHMVKYGYAERLHTALRGLGFEAKIFSRVNPDPDMDCVRAGVAACESFQPDIMFALGGGSPIDAAKFIRIQYEHPELSCEQAATRFVEMRKRTCQFPKVGSKIRQLVVIPTTSGTGSEVTPFAVITGDDGMKYALASYQLTPEVAIIDSTFCDSLPKSLVANAGIDAITHAIESYVSVVQHDFTMEHSVKALKLLFENLQESYEKGTSKSRDAVHRGATIAGIAFGNSFLGICHSLAHKVGSVFHTAHGLTNAILLPHVIRYNASNNPTRMGIYPSYDYPQAEERYAALASAIGASQKNSEGLIEELHKLMKVLDIPLTFHDVGIDRTKFMDSLDHLAEEAFDDQCTPANPRFPLIPELKEILIAAYGE